MRNTQTNLSLTEPFDLVYRQHTNPWRASAHECSRGVAQRGGDCRNQEARPSLTASPVKFLRGQFRKTIFRAGGACSQQKRGPFPDHVLPHARIISPCLNSSATGKRFQTPARNQRSPR